MMAVVRCALLVASMLFFAWAAVADPGRARDEMVRVPRGSFLMGSATGDPDERPQRRIAVSAFELDRTEVTQRAYGACVATGACRSARHYAGLEGPDLPAIGVTWEDAAAYCAYRGKRLPTEAEWEWAARGADGRAYPWGSKPDCARGNFGNFDGEGPCAGLHPGRVLPVGRFPTGQSPVGAVDLGGNAWEWVADWYGPYPAAPATDPQGPAAGRFRVVRGGSCCSYFTLPRATNRVRFAPDYAGEDVGFRCARSLPASRAAGPR